MPLYDQFGAVIDTSKLRRELAGPTVTGVRSTLSGHPTQGLTPGRLGALLREAETGDAVRYLELAEEMEEKNLHYLSVLGTRKRQVAQLDVKVAPADDSAEAKADADLVREWVDNEPLQDEIVDIMDALGKGFSVTEIMWDMSERQWMPARLEFRDPRWFEFDNIDGRTLQVRDLDNRREPLAPFKFVVHRYQAKSGMPVRGGFARMVAWGFLFSSYAVKDWVQFIETYGQPFRIGKFPPGAGEEDKAVLLRALTNLGSDAAAMIPETMMLEFAKTEARGSTGQMVHQQLLAYIDALISKAVLGQTLTTEVGDSGSRALGDVHNEVRRDIERSDAFALSQTLSRDIARPLVALNRGERKRYPRIVVGREETLDIVRFADAFAKLAPLGFEAKASQLYQIMGLEAPEEGDDVIGGRASGEAPDDDDGAASAQAPPSAAAGEALAAGGDDPGAEDEGDPIGALTAAIGDQAGPLIDRWADLVRDVAVETVDSLGALREWIDRQGAESLDIRDVANRLGPALAAAHLAGRYDVEETPVALASASVEHSRLPFAEQIEFFRGKLNLPTAVWTDIWQAQHDRAFTVAGAARDSLLSDLRGAVDSAIAEGTTIARFRRDFDSIVAKHGWSYRGGRSWRTRVIYGTNLRTSYAAGRYRQMKEIVDRRPYWRYRHSHASEQPRQDHLAWDGIVLPHDDPWWDIYYGPNGWGCKCYAEALSRRDLERLGKSGPDKAPAVKMRKVTVGANGPNPRTVEVPEGIDPGWAYAPGQSGVFDDTGSAGE